MFKIDPDPTFETPVKIHVPGKGDGVIHVSFRYLDAKARGAYIQALGNKTNAEALAEVITGWREIDAPYSIENLEKLLNRYDTAATAMFDAFFRESRGAPEKN